MPRDPVDETEVQHRIMDIALKDDETRAEIILSIERIDVALRSICASLVALTPFMRTMILEGVEPMKKETGLVGNVLCDNCAMLDNCSRKGEEIKICSEYRERTDLCSTCSFWDTISCVGAKRCVGGSCYESEKV